MKTEKKLIIIGILSVLITLVLFAIDTAPMYPGISGIFRSIFELGMMAFLIFLIIAMNFFAIAFVVRKVREFL
jgi:NADH:ubiquinone oxidoreductase subunit 3 (subunit A)